ncbi:MAG: type VII secretion protein EccE [Mycobacterium sp.]
MTGAAVLGASTSVLACTVIGWATAGYAGAAVGAVIGLAAFVVPWKHQPAWVWAALYATRNRRAEFTTPATVVNDRAGGGVRYQDGIAVTAIQLLGKAHRATTLIGSMMTQTENTLDLAGLMTVLKHNLGLTFDSVSVVSAGSRRRNNGDYPRVYDTFIGTSPYAGQRDTWLVLRINACDNAEALRLRTSAAAAALAATQRVAAALCRSGIRARVASAADIVELDLRLGSAALEAHTKRWQSLRSQDGWLTTYGYDAGDISTDALAMPWSLRADGVIANVTLLPDSTVTASVTIRTPQPPTVAPSTALRTFPGQQAQLLRAHLCGPLPGVRGLSRGPLPGSLSVPIGSSGVLLGKVTIGDRLLLPLDDPGGHSHVHLSVNDAIAKRILIRTAAAGAQVTVHTTDPERWNSVRMPNVVVTDQVRPATGTTVSVSDGTVLPTPRPPTVLSIGSAADDTLSSADVVITGTGPASVEVRVAGRVHNVEMELFRAENRYAAAEMVLSR